MDRREILQNIKRIVVKIGSSSLSHGEYLSRDRMAQFVRDIAALSKKGFKVTIVTSGAISAGAARMKKRRDTLTIPEKQALAAIGQTILMDEYRGLFLEEGIDIGQILLSDEDVVNRSRFLNARNAMLTLLHMDVIPVVNENDTVSISEIKNESKLGDNDTLAAYVSQIVEADLTILLSDIDGFYQNLDDKKPLDEIHSIDETVWSAAGGSGSAHGKGGMFTKVRAADMIMKSGHKLIIAKAGSELILNRIMDGENIGTLFHGSDRTLDGRKRWIAFNMDIAGSLTIDDGAAKALVAGKKSLLAAGIVSFDGSFEQGDAVEIIRTSGEKLGRGISNYTSNEIDLIKGKKSAEIKKILEDTFYDEAIHRDNMIIF